MKKIFLSVIFLFLIFSPKLSSALNYQISGDPWFISTYTPDLSNLPKGFFIEKVSNLLYNKTDIPIYAVFPNNESGVFENSEIPSKYKPIYKLTKDSRFFYHHQSVQGYNIPKTNWFPEQEDYISLQQLYGKYFNDPNSKTGDNRPNNINTPTDENFDIIFLYNNDEVIIPVNVNYKLNDKYRQDSELQIARSLSDSSQSPHVNLLYILIIIFVGAGIVLFKFIKNIFKKK